GLIPHAEWRKHGVRSPLTAVAAVNERSLTRRRSEGGPGASRPGSQPERAPMTPSPWTDDRVAALRRYWREGLSARQVAERLGGGLTRCAVLGKLHRLQAGRRASPSPPGARSPDARSPGKVALPRSPRDGLTAVRSRSARPPRRAGPPPEDGPGLASVLSIGSQACRWP